MKTLVMLDEQGGKHPVVLPYITHVLVQLVYEMPVRMIFMSAH